MKILTQRHGDTETWPKVKLGTLGQIIRGNGIKRSETTDKGLPCLRYGEIYTSYNVILDRPRSFVSKEVFDRSLHISKGDLVFTLTGETEDEIAKTLAYLGDDEIAAGGDLAVWKNHGCDPKFLSYLMYTPDLIKAKALASNGQIIVHISVKKFQEIEIPLPPLSVQQEIVARLEKELAAVDRMVKGFEAMKAEADQLFKSTLKETFEEIAASGTEIKHLGEVSELIAGFSFKSKEFGAFGDRVIRIGNICPPLIDFKDGFGVDISNYSKQKLQRYIAVAGDCLIAMTGATIGKVGVLKSGQAYVNQRVLIARASSRLNQEYLSLLLCSSAFVDHCVNNADSKAAQPNISAGTIGLFDIPLPPLTTQREVVAKLDAVREKCAKLKSAAEEGLKTAALLRKAILKEAFE